MSWTIDERNAAIAALLKKAASDADFHARAMNDPAAAVKEVAGKDLPAGFKLRLVDNKNADLTLVLPDVASESEELSDAALEQVAGGRCGGSCGGSCAWSDLDDILKRSGG